MKFKELEAAVLAVDLIEEGLTRGMIGAIVYIHEKPSEAYEVEFVDKDGHTTALLTLTPAQLEPYEQPAGNADINYFR